MASCTVYAEVNYIVSAQTLASEGSLWFEEFEENSVSERVNLPGNQTLWSRIAPPTIAFCYVERPSGWVAVPEPTPEDVAAGYRILWGGHQNQVTGEELSVMVDDGALSAAQACQAAAQYTAFDLIDNEGNPLVDNKGRQLQAMLNDVITTIELTDEP